MLGVFIGGPYHGDAWDVGDPPPATHEFTSTGQTGPAHRLTRHYHQARIVDQDGDGASFAIYRLDDDRRNEPSAFERLVDAGRGRFGHYVTLAGGPGDTYTIATGDRSIPAMTGDDVEQAAEQALAAWHWS
jgi:hypothetical protein